jgi:hypothetical protein
MFDVAPIYPERAFLTSLTLTLVYLSPALWVSLGNAVGQIFDDAYRVQRELEPQSSYPNAGVIE